MGYNSATYIHALYQAMNLAFADRDFYYGDPYVPPEEPIEGLLSKDYARKRFEQIDWKKNDPDVKPGDPYPFQGGENPFLELLEQWTPIPPAGDAEGEGGWQQTRLMSHDEAFQAGTTSIQAADAEGWVVSITPSGAWIPAVIAGETGVGLSQRMQSFVLDERLNPYNLVEPGKRPRATLTPGMALKEGNPYLSFAVQGGDTQDQNLLQFFLNVVEFGMNVQQAVEAPNLVSYQMQRPVGAAGRCPRLGAKRAPGDGLRRRQPLAHLGPDHSHRLRPRARHHVGRGERLRGGLRCCLVARSWSVFSSFWSWLSERRSRRPRRRQAQVCARSISSVTGSTTTRTSGTKRSAGRWCRWEWRRPV
jgi:hypothetical protein